MFEAMKHNLWRGQPLSFAVRKIRNGGSRNYEGGSNSLFLHNLTSLSSLFPDKLLSEFLTLFSLSEACCDIMVKIDLSGEAKR